MPTRQQLLDVFGSAGMRVYPDALLPSRMPGQSRDFLTAVGLPVAVEGEFFVSMEPQPVDDDGRSLLVLGTAGDGDFVVHLDLATEHVIMFHRYADKEPWRFMNSSVELLAEFLLATAVVARAATTDGDTPEVLRLIEETDAALRAADPPAVQEDHWWGQLLFEMVHMMF